MEDEINDKKSGLEIADEILDWLGTLCVTVLLCVLFTTFIGRMAVVHGISMEDTLTENDMVLLWSMGYEPKQGDVVACNCDGLGKIIIKRVAAVGGQEINIDFQSGKVYVDGSEFYIDGIDNFTSDSESGLSYPLRVPEGKYFVLGDNRQHSTDSRNTLVGFVDREDIIGKAVMRMLPIRRLGKIK